MRRKFAAKATFAFLRQRGRNSPQGGYCRVVLEFDRRGLAVSAAGLILASHSSVGNPDMRPSRLLAAFACGATLVLGIAASAGAVGTADIFPKPTERQQQAIDVLAKLNAMLVPTREQFVAGSMSFTVYHELAHFLIDEYDIPVLGGREEDMADAYATFELAPYAAKEQMQASVRLWLFYAFLKGTKPVEWWDEHSLDHQRAFQVSCFLSGRWPERYAGLPEAFGASPQRVALCTLDSHRTQTAWIETLRSQAATVIDKQQAVVTYLLAKEGLIEAETWLRASGLLESVATEVQRYRLPAWRIEKKSRLEKDWAAGRYGPTGFERTRQYVEVIAKSCGQANAFYIVPRDTPGVFSIQPPSMQPQHPKIVVCYELVEEFRKLAEQGLPDRQPNN
jgi:hypothetical protein